MKLSIIIPYDRYKQYLHDCLESVYEQRLNDYETLLVVNNKKEIDQDIKAYDINLKILEAGENSSVAKKRNIGLEHASGEYIYFIDCDDYLMPNTLKLLITCANQNDLDLVAGIRRFTWFKKKVFETMGDEKNNELNLKDKDHDYDDKFIEKVYDQNNVDEYMVDVLIRSRHAIRNISVLNVLIKKKLIDEHQIRFNEDFFYYTDVPFVIQLVNYAKSFDRVEQAIFVKRKHNDPINTPALSQIKDSENKFDEFLMAYRYSASLVAPDSYIRYYLDSKMLRYYTKFFARKIRRSKDDIWRNERFKAMGEILKNIHPRLLNKSSRYSKKMIKAGLNGDLELAKKTVSRHLAKIKFKKILKNKNEMNKYLYRHKYINKPLEENTVMFETFMGKSYADSPKYIYEYLAKNYPGKYKFIWVLNDPKEKLPYEGKIVKRFTREYAYYLGVSKYFVFNIRQPLWFRKREEQVFLETWHGTPLKRLAFDQEEVTAASPTYKAQFYRQKQEWDYLIAPNKFSSDIFKSCFMYDGNMLETGYPRNDLLSLPNRDAIALELKKKLGIPLDKKTILYAPTWRVRNQFNMKIDIQELKKQIQDDYVLMLRIHPFAVKGLKEDLLDEFVINVSNYPSVEELYLASDIVITDYSSVMFDYAILNRPMLFFTYDLEDYRDTLRGFNFDFVAEAPGPLLKTSDEVIQSIVNIDKVAQEHDEALQKFRKKFCEYEKGTASEQIFQRVMQNQ